MGLRDRLRDRFVDSPSEFVTSLEQRAARARKSRRYRSIARYGEIPMPGRATLELPAGKVRLRYVAANVFSDLSNFRVPENLRVRITCETTGKTIEVTAPWYKNATSLPANHAWATIGKAKIAVAGPQQIEVEGSPYHDEEEPRVVFG